jgi:hypothetical protein
VTARLHRARPATGRLARPVVCCLMAAMALVGCTSARSNLGTSDSACYLALPAATTAVGHGKLASVHLVTLKSLRRMAPAVFKALDADESTTQRVCVVAFSGTFTTGSVHKPRGRPSGRLAVAVLDTPSNGLIGTVILRNAQRPFGARSIVPF